MTVHKLGFFQAHLKAARCFAAVVFGSAASIFISDVGLAQTAPTAATAATVETTTFYLVKKLKTEKDKVTKEIDKAVSQRDVVATQKSQAQTRRNEVT